MIAFLKKQSRLLGQKMLIGKELEKIRKNEPRRSLEGYAELPRLETAGLSLSVYILVAIGS